MDSIFLWKIPEISRRLVLIILSQIARQWTSEAHPSGSQESRQTILHLDSLRCARHNPQVSVASIERETFMASDRVLLPFPV